MTNIYTRPGGGTGTVTAENGLTATGSTVRIGGAFTQNTDVTNSGNFDVRFYSDNDGVYYGYYGTLESVPGDGTFTGVGLKAWKSDDPTSYVQLRAGNAGLFTRGNDTFGGETNTIYGVATPSQTSYAHTKTNGSATLSKADNRGKRLKV